MSPSRRRVLLKLSGEVLAGEQGHGLDAVALERLSREIQDGLRDGVELGIVMGGGNIIRGTAASSNGMDRATADSMGMLATVINALAIQDYLERLGLTTRVLSAIEMRALSEPYIRRRAVRHLEKGRVVLLAAGTGHPYFTTDTAAVLRAVEIGADVLLKGTKVDGVFSEDPIRNPAAVALSKLGASKSSKARARAYLIRDTCPIPTEGPRHRDDGPRNDGGNGRRGNPA